MSNKGDIKIDTGRIKNTIMNFIVPLVCLGVSGFLGVVIIYPSFKSMPELKQTLQDKSELRIKLQTKIDTLNKMTDYKSVVDEELDLISKVLPEEDNVPYLLNQVDYMTRNSGLELSRLSYGTGGAPQSEKELSPVSMIIVNLGARGTYDQLIQYFKSVEKAARFVDVDNFRYNVEKGKEGEGGISVTFVLSSPYFEVNSKATTDDPINLDITSPDFIKTINFIKSFDFYSNIEISENPEVVNAEEKDIDELTNLEETNEATESELPAE